MSSESNEASAVSPAPPTTTPDADKPSTPKPSLLRTETDANLHSCFICLQNSSETPNAVWVNACPCTLEAHEDCMLTWIAEHERESTKPLRCPACKGKIKTLEPQDRFVGLGDRLHKMYSRMTPAILVGILTGCSMAGSSYYGLMSLSVFTGPSQAMSWLGLGKALADRRLLRDLPWYRWKAGWDFCFRFWLLHFIAPALLIQKALPSQLIDVLAVPASVFYGATLVLRDDMPSWPPSPAWVMTALPWVTFSYNRIYYDLFGAYERRLNRALRGRGLANEEPPADGENPGAQQVNQAGENAAAPDEEDAGYFAQALRVGNAVLNMIGDDNDEEFVAEIELQIGPEEDEQQVVEELQNDVNELNDIIASRNGQALPVAEDGAAQEPQQAGDAQAAVAAEELADAAEPPPAIRIEPRADNQPVQNANNQQAPEEPIREARGTSTTLTDLVNGVVSALTFPLVCWASGEVLRHTLPVAWVTRPHSRAVTGLLQEQWGRSIVGGAMYIVARDMVNLYTKHRRVEVRKQRRVKNVPRRKAKGLTRQNTEATAHS
ncbi:unnamed protein product [Discula destructiva]